MKVNQLNRFIILKKIEEESTSDSGIILDSAVPDITRALVVYNDEVSDLLAGDEVIFETGKELKFNMGNSEHIIIKYEHIIGMIQYDEEDEDE